MVKQTKEEHATKIRETWQKSQEPKKDENAKSWVQETMSTLEKAQEHKKV